MIESNELSMAGEPVSMFRLAETPLEKLSVMTTTSVAELKTDWLSNTEHSNVCRKAKDITIKHFITLYMRAIKNPVN